MIKLDRKGKEWVVAWAFLLIGFYVLTGTFAVLKMRGERADAHENHRARIGAGIQEKGKTWVDPNTIRSSPGKGAARVALGIYVDHIVELSTKGTSWTVDFSVWFRWRDKELQPGETFKIMDSEEISRERVLSLKEGEEYYELYRVVARITKFFNVTRYPRDDHLLTISVEEGVTPFKDFKYVPDTHVSDLSSRAKLPGYRVHETVMVDKPHAYKTNRGDPRFKPGDMAVYDRVIYGIYISRPDWGLYFKMFQSLFASVAIALLVFLMDPKGEERVGLGIGAFFAAVAASYVSSTELPGVGVLTLSDMINIMGLATIFLSVFCSIIVMHVAKDENRLELARLLDKLSLGIFMVGYPLVNILTARVASGGH